MRTFSPSNSTARRSGLLASLATLAVGFLPAAARADVKLPHIIGSNMVLQQEQPVTIWGWADAGEQVSVALAGQTQTATAEADGLHKWVVKFQPLKAGGPLEMTVKGKNTIDVKNILVGEVWGCSGQSNMEFGMGGAHNASVEIPKANYPKIRLFTVKKHVAFEPQADCEGEWAECTPDTVKGFTAVGYFFGRDIHQALDLPVGLIHTSWGGTPAEAWTSIEKLKSTPALSSYADEFEKLAGNLPAAKEHFETVDLPKWEAADKKWKENQGKLYAEQLKEFNAAAQKARAAGQPEPVRPVASPAEPRRPSPPDQNPHTPSVLYNGMIAPIIPFGIRGFIWYQGEANAGRAVEYRTLFPAMITDWRERWGEGNFTFLWVQLANYMDRTSSPTQTAAGWPGLREAQSMTLSLPNTGQAVIIDIGMAKDIHPKDKLDVGHRLALAAEKVAYGKDIVYSGPTYDSMTVEGDKVRIKFKNVDGGLVIGSAPPIVLGAAQEAPASELKGFSIAGADKNFVWADATIDGDSVIVSSAQVKDPKAVRYGWANNPEVNLYNKEALPASPFRTDTWADPEPTRK